jgi:chloramphenicol 3-O phosphotransferase
MHMGPDSLIIGARVALADEIDAGEAEDLADEIDSRLSEKLPLQPHVFIDPTQIHRPGPDGLPDSPSQLRTHVPARQPQNSLAGARPRVEDSHVMTRVIVLNGGSSSGKTGIARCLQAVLPQPWLRLSVDDLVGALPPALLDHGAGIAFGGQGEVSVGTGFRAAENAWMAGLAAMVRAGARVVWDDVFLGGAVSQERIRAGLAGLDVLWVGVRCDPETAAGRELARGDRTRGMASSQAAMVHEGVAYDVEVDTSHTESLACARLIASHVS